MHSVLQFDCLDYYSYRETPAYQELRDVTIEHIPYCFRPATNEKKLVLEDSINPQAQYVSFQELSVANISVQQLFTWSVSINVIEQYQYYLYEPKSSLNKYFYNCSEPWFGLKCQYSFDFDKRISFNQIIDTVFLSKMAYDEASYVIFQTSCYVLLKCYRNGEPWCLDWREVCNGVVDCFDDGLDEESCFELEKNECSENEFRCRNGLCIDASLWEQGEGDADCLDQSDQYMEVFNSSNCFQYATFRCEEHTCTRSSTMYPCGDGQCCGRFKVCNNGRHKLFINAITAQGNLTEKCWIAMVCLTEIGKYVNGTLCETWKTSNSTYEFLKECDYFFQFPTIPVYSDHVRFFYKSPYSRTNLGQHFLPDYICFDQHLCDFLEPQLIHGNLTCLKNVTDVFNTSIFMYDGPYIIQYMGFYFRPCMNFRGISDGKANYSDHPLLYNCPNSPKLMSKHRIMDMESDCRDRADERYENSCLLNHTHRVRCKDTNNCWSYASESTTCSMDDISDEDEVPFESFCDGIETHYFEDNNGDDTSEESACRPEWCDNIYARCDGYLACSDGRDENNCTRIKCPSETYPCISSLNYTVICLDVQRFRDNEADCLGLTGEQPRCHGSYASKSKIMSFRCSYWDECIGYFQLCDGHNDCPDGEDENFCSSLTINCEKRSSHNYSAAEEILCGLNEGENRESPFFSVHSSNNYPRLTDSVASHTIQSPVGLHTIENINEIKVENSSQSWYCNRGLIVRTWNENNSNGKVCICPPSYYGNLCQYQNQRISMTLRLTADDRLATYAIVSMLIDDDDERQEIHAYEESVYIPKESCSAKMNQYLLFPTRPKNVSKKYGVRTDIFEKNKLSYAGSWYFPIDFLFLPVNRLAVSIQISRHLSHTSSNCASDCQHGSCIKYSNRDKHFCRCFPGWSGVHCNISMNCELCFSGSICIGSSKNRSICICPVYKFGPRCIIDSLCPIDACQNNGRCVPSHMSASAKDYICICSDQFYGSKCQFSKSKVDVSLTDIKIPSYLIAYFLTLSNQSNPSNAIVIRKLTLFQQTVTFNITEPFHMMIAQANYKYYLAILQHSPKTFISTSISPAQECILSDLLFNSTILKMPQYTRFGAYYELCGKRHDLSCFVDESFFCLCTNDHHANCLKLIRYSNFQCSSKTYCENEAQCLQDHQVCPSTRICVCPKCFFGNRCQFYAKGLGSTLDEILGYEFKNKIPISRQPMTVQVSAIVTMIIFIIGTINGILSIMTFSRKNTQKVGCGLYLFASSITSLSTMILFTLKFWFLFLSHQDVLSERNQKLIINVNCMLIETLLKMVSHLDNWFNACVAIERTLSVYQRANFARSEMKRVAKRVIIVLPIFMGCLFIPQLLNLHVFEDKTEERSWCVVIYSPRLQMYTYTLLFFHYFAPLFINVMSATFIIIATTRQRALSKIDRSFWKHFKIKFKQYKHLVISPTIIVVLTSPYLIISIVLDCNKSSNLLWFYLVGYFLSFIPAASIFITFVLPSTLYRQEFWNIIISVRKRFYPSRLNRQKF
ncbi:unnamed protein product [Rotaria socialis]|uniref:Uncharacterized protein n=6 Tax=Rotaria socialis TaxID=392032 RepID=A0A817RPM3_9BILA|nr:unnamed protein product [Rotaria socialis]CAF3755913.1 unnamed protein product [Rotaria socialis]CAF4487097.1 unnamed protein product [Rotaria socialis]